MVKKKKKKKNWKFIEPNAWAFWVDLVIFLAKCCFEEFAMKALRALASNVLKDIFICFAFQCSTICVKN